MSNEGLDGKSGDELIAEIRKRNDVIMERFYKKLPPPLKPKTKKGGDSC